MVRPTKFKDEQTIRIAVALYEVGKTDAEVAEILGVCEDTITNWKKKHAKFFVSIKDAKEIADQAVENALYKRAVGFDRIVERSSNNGVVPCIEQIPPDPTCIKYWLNNRKPKEWRDKTEVDQNINIVPVINIGIPKKE